MRAILFAPHNDDETLFAFYTMLRLKPTVVVALRSYRQAFEQGGPHFPEREAETEAVCDLVGVPYTQWGFSDMEPDWLGVAEAITASVAMTRPDVIISPAWEMGGHDDHNKIALLCAAAVQELGCRHIEYLTYVRGSGRSSGGVEVVASQDERELKREALALYRSQAEHPPTAGWFDPLRYGDLREWRR